MASCGVCGAEALVTAQAAGEAVNFCEECYRIGYFAGLSCEEVAELHYQFGQSYAALGRYSEGVDALHAGMRLLPRPEMLLAAANCYEALGNTELAEALRLKGEEKNK